MLFMNQDGCQLAEQASEGKAALEADYLDMNVWEEEAGMGQAQQHKGHNHSPRLSGACKWTRIGVSKISGFDEDFLD